MTMRVLLVSVVGAWVWGLGLGMPGKAYAAEVDPAVREALQRFDRSFEKVLPWLASLYDPKSGGFFNCAAAREVPQYGPDIQSTAQALDIARISGARDEQMPDALRRKFIEYFQSRQDPRTGYFIDPPYRAMMLEPRHERVLGRALNYSTSHLARLGAQPLHPLPGAGETESRPPHLRSVEAWGKWLKKNVGDKPGWTEMDRLQSQGTALRSLPEKERDAYIDLAVAHIAATQNPQTGLWGDTLDGAFKAALFLRGVKRPIPRADAVFASVMQWIRRRPDVEQASRVGNPARLLALLREDLSEPIRPPQLLEVIAWYEWVIKPFQRDDGAFSRFKDQSPIAPNDMHLGWAKTPQSNMNGTTMMFRARESLYLMAGLDTKDIPPLPGAETFYASLAER